MAITRFLRFTSIAVPLIAVVCCRAQSTVTNQAGSAISNLVISDSFQTNTLASPDDAYPITADDKKFLASVVDAINRRDFAWIANHTIYSVSIASSNGTQLVDTSEEFREILNRELTDSIRAKILDAAKQPLFKNWQGVMIGDGILWFDEYSTNENGPWTYDIEAIGGFAFRPEDWLSSPDGTNEVETNAQAP
jgi:hypothetical protein